MPPPDYSEFEAHMGFKTRQKRTRAARDLSGVRAQYDREQAAYRLNVSLRKLDDLLQTKQLRFKRIGRSVRVTHEELQRFMKTDHD